MADLAELTMMLQVIGPKKVSQEEFENAAKEAAGFANLDNETRLTFYGLYKQATVGDVNVASPWSIEFVAKAKWWFPLYMQFIVVCLFA
jgi:hypothetical protein